MPGTGLALARDAWDGESSFSRLYPEVRADDVPFADDCLGDQFLMRDGRVCKLAAVTGEVESLGLNLSEFLEAVSADPIGVLAMNPLLQFQQDGGHLEPGHLLAAFPPFCSTESANEVSLSAITSDQAVVR